MASRFEALDDLLDDSLSLPVKGTDGKVRTYTIPSPTAEDGLKIERTMEVATKAASDGQAPADSAVLDDAAELDLYRLALGDAYDAAHAELNWIRFRHLAMTAVMWITAGIDTAETYWKAGGDPSRVAPENRAQRRAASSAAAKSTRSRGSTSGTKAPARKRPAAAA